ncbi:MAG: Arc family DNA binding domain-containing protein [Candidatus Riflebacteria bacterium]|nr:Arc family DNA binding domain-containing protein [Candidatus Riflebacteria bacterium]
MAERKSFLLRIPADLHDEISAWAHQELRSVNGQIEWILKEAVARRRRAAADDPERPRPALEGRDLAR